MVPNLAYPPLVVYAPDLYSTKLPMMNNLSQIVKMDGGHGHGHGQRLQSATLANEKLCPICNQTFKNLKKHLLSHTVKVKSHSMVCERCDLKFENEQDLVNHNKKYCSSNKPFCCDICGKRFTQAGNLKTHLRIHTGDRPFACNLCDKKFTQSINLINHLRTHSKERPFKCSICEKTFTQSGNLKTHIRTHNTDTRLNCHLCNKSYTQYVNLKKHFLNSHPETSDFI